MAQAMDFEQPETTFEIPKLEDICLDYVIKRGNFSPEVIPEWWILAQRTGSRPFQNFVLKMMKERYGVIQQRVGDTRLREVLGEELFCSIFEKKELRDWKTVLENPGSVIENRLPVTQEGLVYGVDLPLCEYYPLSCLVSGVSWPSNVNPAHRERYLNDRDFEQVMGMTKDEFRQLPLFKRILLKKDTNLF